ncbi:XRE family transcriptional regulator [Streptomyces lunaelactis]|uniref:helix-turn-helix domain-containing protein n=1 Tax=Streptomyces lunaelactis TaxID=1535768 RepID=UPI001584F215|nr:XRE family transcriptional regulator [Streptomyces lunaelactis]NUK09177.1 XRE family transcriptional regulator [Streptomyces lunaelactis]NUK33713.1 XRE family transcriptional regulator [Streptomyces lunaelactis]NUK41767.1 XRE family transcriptional regulator [Streptomyces lunaelactis]NUK92285.1 XRE family transcriptional regulator [Streptomyces lunaelactis]NUL10494.1 XRE family transcriptional regulator [Streptomyces lunaelactis]
MSDDRPAWARRIAAEREARQWSQAEAVAALRAHAPKRLPEGASMVRQWKRWESGEVTPSEFYQPIIAATFGTVTHALFPVASRRDGNAEIIAASGMETLDIISRLQASDVDSATLDALRITTDRLCSEYPHLPSGQLAMEGRQWLKRVAGLQSQRLTLAQHREVLTLSGWLALLIGCVEYDMGDRGAAESTRRAALSLASEAGNSEIAGWAHEMRAWFALTTGDYRGILAASQAGTDAAPSHGVAVQLAAQEAKGWARVGDRRQTEVALDRGRKLLEGMPYPENLDHHFVVDPSKFDFYAMDCYRLLGEDRFAENLAHEVIRAGTDFDGTERAPMRMAEARITLGVVAARQGDLDQAVNYGAWALKGDRQSLPSLLMVSRELAAIVNRDYASEAAGRQYLDHLNTISRAS